MENFTAVRGTTGTESRGFRSRNLLIGIGVVSMALVLLQLVGILRLELGEFRIVGKQNLKAGVQRAVGADSVQSTTRNATSEMKREDSFGTFGSGLAGVSALGLAERIKSKFEQDALFRNAGIGVNVELFEFSGLGMPLFKNGTAKYKLAVTASGSQAYRADIDGSFEISATGLSQSARLESAVADEIAAQVYRDVRDDFKK